MAQKNGKDISPPNPPEGGTKRLKKRRHRITLRLTTEELEKLRRLARERGMTISDYLRATSLSKKSVRRKQKTEEMELYRQAIYELNRLGVNLNQLAKTMNTAIKMGRGEQFFSAVQHLERLKAVEEALIEVAELLKEVGR